LSYRVEFTDDAAKQMRKLDKYTRKIIYHWLSKHLEGSDNPFVSGHALTGGMSGLWRYMIGDYRLICAIKKDRLIVLVLEVGHRAAVYTQ